MERDGRMGVDTSKRDERDGRMGVDTSTTTATCACTDGRRHKYNYGHMRVYPSTGTQVLPHKCAYTSALTQLVCHTCTAEQHARARMQLHTQTGTAATCSYWHCSYILIRALQLQTDTGTRTGSLPLLLPLGMQLHTRTRIHQTERLR